MAEDRGESGLDYGLRDLLKLKNAAIARSQKNKTTEAANHQLRLLIRANTNSIASHRKINRTKKVSLGPFENRIPRAIIMLTTSIIIRSIIALFLIVMLLDFCEMKAAQDIISPAYPKKRFVVSVIIFSS